MKLLRVLFVSAVMCVTSSAYALTEVNKTPTTLGVINSGSLAYFSVAETLSTVCGANVLLITMDAAGNGKTAFAAVLIAKATGKQISYISYTKDGAGNCYVNQVEIAS